MFSLTFPCCPTFKYVIYFEKGSCAVLQKEPIVAKNTVKLLEICWNMGFSNHQIKELTEPISKANTINEKEKVAEILIEKLKLTKN